MKTVVLIEEIKNVGKKGKQKQLEVGSEIELTDSSLLCAAHQLKAGRQKLGGMAQNGTSRMVSDY